MRVLLIGHYGAERNHSMNGFADVLLAGLRERGMDVRLIAAPMRLGKWGTPHAGIGKWLGYADRFALFPAEMRRQCAWADVTHVCDQANAMYMPSLQDVPHLLTCHDVLGIRAALNELPEWPTGATGRIYQKLILRGLKRTRHMACVSETTREEVLRLTGNAPECVRRVYNGPYQTSLPVSQAEGDAALEALALPRNARFFLHIGSNPPYKNRGMALKIYGEYCRRVGKNDLHLVLVGKPLPPALVALASELGLTERIAVRSGISPAQLQALYSRATALIFPSLYEGFGLPIIEAQACGCPVFTSDRLPMTEVGGDAAVYFDPTRPADAAGVIAAHLDAPGPMIEAGYRNTQRFTRDKMLDGYAQAYLQILDGTFCASKNGELE